MMNTSRQSTENKNRITALYERLSQDDAVDGVSNSIINQQKILEDFAVKGNFTNIRHFSDDGYSGTNWERPGWKSLIAEVEAGNVGAIICKDMSRIGRDYLQVGLYTEVLFRKHGVRFIAVGNNIDSDNKESAEFAPFLNLMSEWYARDCSRKVKAVAQARGNNGIPLAAVPVYGYKKAPNDNNKWVIDEEAAAIVRRVFQMTIDGNSQMKIARTFMQEEIETPTYYKTKNNIAGGKKNGFGDGNPYRWSQATIRRMLSKVEYCGHVVNFRTYRDSYKDKGVKYNPESEWKVFENCHEAIIDQATYDTVQKLLGTPRRHGKTGEPNPLTGLLWCNDCGGKMHNSRSSTGITNYMSNGELLQRDVADHYNCSTYILGKSQFETRCSGHYIRTVVVRELVLDSIRKICGYVRDNQAEFIEKVREESVLRRGETAKLHKKLSLKMTSELPSLIICSEKLMKIMRTES